MRRARSPPGEVAFVGGYRRVRSWPLREKRGRICCQRARRSHTREAQQQNMISSAATRYMAHLRCWPIDRRTRHALPPIPGGCQRVEEKSKVAVNYRTGSDRGQGGIKPSRRDTRQAISKSKRTWSRYARRLWRGRIEVGGEGRDTAVLKADTASSRRDVGRAEPPRRTLGCRRQDCR
jgi:hypothetical protein